LGPILRHLLRQGSDFLEEHDIGIDTLDELNKPLSMCGPNPIQVPSDDSHGGGSLREVFDFLD